MEELIVEYSLELHLEQTIESAHPSIGNVLKFFRFKHLPPGLKEVSEVFARTALSMVSLKGLQGTEATVGLRKLLEAKDCFVRASLETK